MGIQRSISMRAHNNGKPVEEMYSSSISLERKEKKGGENKFRAAALSCCALGPEVLDVGFV
jgi:hypothetical protein